LKPHRRMENALSTPTKNASGGTGKLLFTKGGSAGPPVVGRHEINAVRRAYCREPDKKEQGDLT